MPRPSRWERGKRNARMEKVTSSSVVETDWKNPLRDHKKNQYAVLKVGKTVRFGVGWKF